jgi:hypothetical protein
MIDFHQATLSGDMLDRKAYLKATRHHHASRAGAALLSARSPLSIQGFLSVESILSAGSILGSAGYRSFRELEDQEES